MYDHLEQPPVHTPERSPFRIAPAHAEVAPQPEAGRQADPHDVINFLLKKIEEQQLKIEQQAGLAAAATSELETLKASHEALKGELAAAKQENERQLADYDVLMQNTLMVEHELEQLKFKATERPTIQLPFYTEQKLAKLGYPTVSPEASGLEEREAV